MRRCYFAALSASLLLAGCAIMVAGFAVLIAPPFVLRAARREGWPRLEPPPALEAEP